MTSDIGSLLCGDASRIGDSLRADDRYSDDSVLSVGVSHFSVMLNGLSVAGVSREATGVERADPISSPLLESWPSLAVTLAPLRLLMIFSWRCRRDWFAIGQPDALRCEIYLPVTCPEPLHPGIGHLSIDTDPYIVKLFVHVHVVWRTWNYGYTVHMNVHNLFKLYII